MESEEGQAEGQKHLRMTHYYYINYKQFVNVVKYRLDHMRRKLEMEEKKVREVVQASCFRSCVYIHVCVCAHAL